MDILTDAQLDTWKTSNDAGKRNSEPYLRHVPAEYRNAVVAEAYTLMNMAPGFNFSGAVYQAAKTFQHSGKLPYTAAATILARKRERQGQDTPMFEVVGETSVRGSDD